jgi:hypothetical protein
MVVLAAGRMPVGVDIGLAVPNLLAGGFGIAVAVLVAVRYRTRVSVLAGLGAAFYLVSEMVWLAYLYATRPELSGAAPHRSETLVNASNAAIAGLQVAAMAALILAAAAAGARDRWRRIVVILAAVPLLVLVTGTTIGWYRGTLRIPQAWLQAPGLAMGAVGLALTPLVMRAAAAVLAAGGSALWVVWSWCAVRYAALFPGPHASQDELIRFYRDTGRMSTVTAVGNETYLVRRVLTALGFGLVVLAVLVAVRSRAPSRPAAEVAVEVAGERGRQVRLLATAAALGLALAVLAVWLGWLAGPGQHLPEVPP